MCQRFVYLSKPRAHHSRTVKSIERGLATADPEHVMHSDAMELIRYQAGSDSNRNLTSQVRRPTQGPWQIPKGQVKTDFYV